MPKRKISDAWKNHEKRTARILGGFRNSRGSNFSQSIVDVEHPTLSVECKYTSSNKLSPFIEMVDKNVLVELEDTYITMYLEDFVKCLKLRNQ